MSENLALLVFFLHLLFAVFLITVKTGKPLSNRLLAVFLLITALDISNFVFGGFYRGHLDLDMMRANLAALLAPILYFYTKSILIENFTWRVKDVKHLIPFFIISILFIPRFHLGDTSCKLMFYSNHQPMLEMLLAPMIMHLQIAGYLLLIFLLLKNYNKAVNATYSNLSRRNKGWLTNFMLLFLLDFILVSSRNIIKFSSLDTAFNMITPLMLSVTLGFICWIIWQGLHHPEIFKGIEGQLLNDRGTIKKPNHVNIDDNQAQQIIASLERHMGEQQPYLQANLTIDKLATQLGIDSLDLSWTLNHYLNLHFFDYINKHRIEAATRVMAADNNHHKTLLEILYEVGFNSKSSFNTAFKKHQGVTPSQYRKSQHNEN